MNDAHNGGSRFRVRVKRDCGRSWGYVGWLPFVIDFGYLTYNRWWRHNLCATFAWVYLLRYGRWPLYHEWDKARKRRGI